MGQFGEPANLTPAAPKRSFGVIAALTIALAASVTLNVFLSNRVRGLTQGQTARRSDHLLKAGVAVPPIAAKRLGGQQEVITYQSSNEPTVLYIFTPPCSWCARNLDNFKTLWEKESRQYRFIGVSLSEEGLAQYVAKNDLRLPVYSELSRDVKAAYKLSGTPQTIVVSPEGRVLQDWVGAYVGEEKSQVEAFFHVNLPGLRELPKAEAANEKLQTAPQPN
jgi:peroxiredoxin